jgi:hypothetical protein
MEKSNENFRKWMLTKVVGKPAHKGDIHKICWILQNNHPSSIHPHLSPISKLQRNSALLSFHHIIYTISEIYLFWWKFEKTGKNIWLPATKKIAIFVKLETWKNKTLCFTIYRIPGACLCIMYSWVWNIQRQICLISWQWATSDGIHL